MKNVSVLTGAGQIGLAIVRRIGSGMKIVVSDKNAANAASAPCSSIMQVLMPSDRGAISHQKNPLPS